MPDFVVGSAPILVFGIIAIIATALYIREYSLRKKLDKESRPSEIDKVNYHTLSQLTGEAHDMVNQAEKEATKLVQDSKLFSDQATHGLTDQLNAFLQDEERHTAQAMVEAKESIKSREYQFEKFLTQLTQLLDNNSKASTKEFEQFLENLKTEAKQAQVANWQGVQTRVGELFENFETKLADFLLQTEQKMMLSVDLELKSARSLIDTYKVQQMNLIDENIVAMLEKTLSLVLAKNLNLKDQMDFVYESLEKAKTEKFLV